MRVEKKHQLRKKRHFRIRNKITGTGERPRLSVHFSSKNIYCQVIDDKSGMTLASASTIDKTVKSDKHLNANVSGAAEIGRIIAEKATAAGIQRVVFDRGGFRFHGKVKALAEAARQNGLNF